MADEEGLEDRTEEATPHRRQEWKKDGKVSQSRELVGALVLLTLIGVLYGASQWMLKGVWVLFQNSWSDLAHWSGRDWSVETVISIARFSFQSILYITAPVLAAAFVVAIGGSVVQTGLVWSTKSFEMDPNKLNPMNGIKRIVGPDGWVEMLKSVIKFTLVGSLVYTLLKRRLSEAGSLFGLEASQISLYVGWNLILVLATVAGAMLVISALDFGWQRFRYEQKIKMTKQEVKEERRQMDGNPQIKARVRQLQRKIATSKMVEAVKAADVIVTNPTHIAVALQFDRDNMHAPKVVAKGADYMAEQIKKIARENGIPCVENVPLARAMYKALKIGQFISRDLYNAVAEVLAYVYRLKGRTV